MQKLRAAIERYVPWDAQETADRMMLLRAIDELDSPLSRENPFAHFTASAWIVNPRREKALMAWHNIYRSWAWTGGHADGESDLLATALREAREETGLQAIQPVSREIYSLEVLPVSPHVKRGSFVPAHLHLNVTYLLCADDGQKTRCKPDENSAVAWLPLEKAADNREEPFMALIYQKLNRKLSVL